MPSQAASRRRCRERTPRVSRRTLGTAARCQASARKVPTATRAQDVSRMNVGRVVVAALPSVSSTLLPRAVVRFQAQHPGVSFVLKDALAERIVDMIRRDDVDFG